MSDYEPREFDYDLVKRLVFTYLWKSHHERHLEDCVQYCALAWLEGRTNVQWTVIDYCRINGIGDRGKVGARALEHATLVGLATDENEDNKENGFLLDIGAIQKHEEELEKEIKQDACNILGRLEEFLRPINLKEETLKWALRNYRPRVSRKNVMTFNTLRTRSI